MKKLNCLPLEYMRESWEFESKSRPGHKHLATVNRKTGDLACDCLGFYHQKECWHVKRIRELRTKAAMGYRFVCDEVTEVDLFANIVVFPRITLGTKNTLRHYATVVFDMLELGMPMYEVRNVLPIIPRDWTVKGVEGYIEKNGRYTPTIY